MGKSKFYKISYANETLVRLYGIKNITGQIKHLQGFNISQNIKSKTTYLEKFIDIMFLEILKFNLFSTNFYILRTCSRSQCRYNNQCARLMAEQKLQTRKRKRLFLTKATFGEAAENHVKEISRTRLQPLFCGTTGYSKFGELEEGMNFRVNF